MFELTPEQMKLHLRHGARVDAILATMGTDNPYYFGTSRLKAVGASDVNKLMGGAYGSPRSLWEEKTLRVDLKPQTLQMRVGTFSEPLIADLYAEKTRQKVVKAKTIVNAKLPYLAANFDRLIVDDAGNVIGGLECKTCGYNSNVLLPDGTERAKWGKGNVYDYPSEDTAVAVSTSAEIDPIYYGQVQFYMLVSGLPSWDVAVLISNSDFRVYTVPADPDYQLKMLAVIHDFWVNHVLTDVPPEPLFKDLTAPSTADTEAMAPVEVAKTVLEIKRLGEQIKQLEAKQEDLKDSLAPLLEEHTKLLYPNKEGKMCTLCTFKSTKRETFDSARFKEEQPELYQKYLKTTESKRIFRLGRNFDF